MSKAIYKHDVEINGTNCATIDGKEVEVTRFLCDYPDGDRLMRVDYDGKSYQVWESCLTYRHSLMKAIMAFAG